MPIDGSQSSIFLDKDLSLVIPFESDIHYHWWKPDSQSINQSYLELGITDHYPPGGKETHNGKDNQETSVTDVESDGEARDE
jgi:hypothetical protein